MRQPSGGSCTSKTRLLSTHCLKNTTVLSKEQQLVWGHQRTQARKFYVLDHTIHPAYMNLAVMDICECFLSDL